VALLLVVVVVAVAAIGSKLAGALAAVWAAACFDFFFTLPYYRLTIRSSSDVTTFLLLLVVGVAVSQLAARARRLKVIAITDAAYLAQIHETASMGNSARSPDVVVDHVREQLISLLDLETCRFEYGSLLGHPPRLEPDGTVMVGRSRWDIELSGLPGDEVELRTFGNGAGLQAVAAGAPGRCHAGRSGRAHVPRNPDRPAAFLTGYARSCLPAVVSDLRAPTTRWRPPAVARVP